MTFKEKKISFLIPTYKTGNYVIKLIDSILEKCDFSQLDKQILICVDHNEKEEFQLIKNYIKDKIKEIGDIYLPCFKIFQNKKNRGIGYTVNKLVNMAESKYVMRLDSDTLFYHPNYDEEMVKIMERDSSLALLTSVTNKIMQIKQKVNIPETIIDNPSEVIKYVKNLDREEVSYYDDVNSCFAGFIFLFRKEDFKKIGNFDDSVPMYGEDNMFFMQTLEAGFKCAVANKLFIYHDYHGVEKNKGFTPEQVAEFRRKAEEIWNKRKQKMM